MKFGTHIAEIGRLIVVYTAGFSFIIFVAINTTTVFATEHVRGPIVVQLTDKTCKFIPRGKAYSVKNVNAGAEPRNIVIRHKRVVEEQRFQTMLVFGISPSASSADLCRYLMLRSHSENSERLFRSQAIRQLSNLSTESLKLFRDPKNKNEQKSFEDFVHRTLGGYAHTRGLVVLTARFDRLKK